MRRFWRRFRSRFQSDKAPEEGLDSEETVSVALLAVGDFPWAYATDPPKNKSYVAATPSSQRHRDTEP